VKKKEDSKNWLIISEKKYNLISSNIWRVNFTKLVMNSSKHHDFAADRTKYQDYQDFKNDFAGLYYMRLEEGLQQWVDHMESREVMN